MASEAEQSGAGSAWGPAAERGSVDGGSTCWCGDGLRTQLLMTWRFSQVWSLACGLTKAVVASEVPVVVLLFEVACGGAAFPMRFLLPRIRSGCREVGPLQHHMVMMIWIDPDLK